MEWIFAYYLITRLLSLMYFGYLSYGEGSDAGLVAGCFWLATLIPIVGEALFILGIFLYWSER